MPARRSSLTLSIAAVASRNTGYSGVLNSASYPKDNVMVNYDKLYPDFYALFCDRVAFYLGRNMIMGAAVSNACRDLENQGCKPSVARAIGRWALPYVKASLEAF
jgi:hypothetical protein